VQLSHTCLEDKWNYDLADRIRSYRFFMELRDDPAVKKSSLDSGKLN